MKTETNIAMDTLAKPHRGLSLLAAKQLPTVGKTLAALAFTGCLLFAHGQPAYSSTKDSCQAPTLNNSENSAIKELNILGNDFPALHGLTDAVTHCVENYKINAEHTQTYRELQIPALSATPSNFDVILTGNNAIVPLLNDGLLQPLDALIEKYAPQLPDRNRVTFDNKTMAIAALANAQHLYVRDDLLRALNASAPENFSDLINLCEKIKLQSDMRYPLIASFKAGWDLGLEFINHYLGSGGSLGSSNSAHDAASVNNASGVAALENLEAMAGCMNPDYLSQGINDIQAIWQAGDAAIAFLWGSRASSILDSKDTLPVVRANTRLLGAPRVTTPDSSQTLTPASTLWWVGFAIPKNLPDERAAAGFNAMLQGLNSQYLLEHYNDEAVWLLKDYSPARSAKGVQQVVDAGTASYPSDVLIGLLHHAAGEQIPAFLQGRLSAEETLQAIDAWVDTSAREKGYRK